ncbi:hypothetical protein AJ80_04880 [Polytolypa hystricis UAMH7299]|uniref:Uncharacterized protein n=1 Tax=Polytolypa hystricis (strain UAMH7299) TaxID=1447883 RepID=A0A2B7Y8I6_POLH7|nr:hypothetical protein AJ80_04880 [Polytolypa hystricis UAMH7299]
MESLTKLVTRGDDGEQGLSSTTINLLISLLVLVLFSLALIGLLLVIRRKRQAQKQSELPLYNSQCGQTSNHRRLTITATPYHGKHESVYVIDEKRSLVQNSSSPPTSPVPEIRITFPEEEDASGKRTSGRVVVVRISDKGGVGLEPCDEDLPPYQSDGQDRFQSLDLDRMGGLKEKEDLKRWS